MPLFISFIAGVFLFYLFQYFVLLSIFIFVASSAILLLKRNTILISVIIIGILYAHIRGVPVNQPVDVWDTKLTVTGRFVPKIRNAHDKANIQTFMVSSAVNTETGNAIAQLSDEQISLITEFNFATDRSYELLVRTFKDRTRLNPGGPRRARLYATVAAYKDTGDATDSLVDTLNYYRNELNGYAMERFSADTAGLVAAITTGERRYISRDLRDAFNITGLAHILSISGTHFGLFSVMLFGLFSFLIKRLPYNFLNRLTMYITPSQASALLCIPFMVSYLGISGGSLPAIRSFVMITLFLAGLLLGRKGFWLNSLLIAAVILVLWDPGVILGLSFQLSFIAVLFIGFALEADAAKEKVQVEVEENKEGGKEEKEIIEIKVKGEKQRNKFIRYLRNALLITVAAWVGTAPLVAYYFHYLSVIAPLSNLLVAPIIGFVVIPLSLISSFSYLVTGSYLFAPFIVASADISLTIVKLLAEIPLAGVRIPAFPPFLVITFYACFLTYIVLGKRKWILMLSFIPFLVYIVIALPAKRNLTVHFLDVGQGDSAVVELPDKKTVVIDTGRSGRETASFLRSRGINSVDALILSHVHPDHTGGFKYITERFNVNEIWDNGRIAYPERFLINTSHRTLERGDVLNGRSYAITVLHPYRRFYTLFGTEYNEENNESLVIKISGKGKSFLFTGDIEGEAETDLVNLTKWLRSDVLKVPHHGSRMSTGHAFLSEVSPTMAVISSGRGNSFGHPNAEVLRKLKGASILRTDINGAIKITETESGFKVKTYNEFVLRKTESLKTEWQNIKRLFKTW
jgi:competence protein ComEC